jgi:aromatic-L-amino-acid decarboxylase
LARQAGFHMTPEEFRRHGRELIDWLARYEERVESLPVLSRVRPGDVAAALPDLAPEAPEPFETVLRDVEQVILPGITHWQSPNFFAFFPANASGPSILGELLSAGLGVQGMLWVTSPACTELETRVLDWLVGLLGLPDRFHSSSAGAGVIQDSASSAALCALLAGRERAARTTNTTGCDGKLVAYASSEAHSSIEKAVRISGVGSDNLRRIEVDEQKRMRPDALEAALHEDRAAGRVPCFVCATVGTTSSQALDPLEPIGKICAEHGVWLHVDAAMAGSAAICPEFRYIQAGLERADSYCFNPHKWLFTNFDCDCFWVADRHALIDALSILPDYLRNRESDSGAVTDYRDWQVPLGRRFRSLKLWFVIRHYGAEGLRHHIREHIRLAQQFATWVREHECFELAAPVPLNLVCFRHVGGDAVNQALLDRLNASGEMYITQTRLDGRLTLRFSIGQTHTEARHVARAWECIVETAERSTGS